MTKNALLVVSLAAVTVAVALFSPRPDPGPRPVREVAPVRHSDAADAPEKKQKARTMVASFYAGSLEGNPTASGETYKPERYTAAHKNLPLGARLKISYRGESVKVTVNDRGPYAPDHDLDLSFAAAEDLGLVEPGAAPVRVTVL